MKAIFINEALEDILKPKSLDELVRPLIKNSIGDKREELINEIQNIVPREYDDEIDAFIYLISNEYVLSAMEIYLPHEKQQELFRLFKRGYDIATMIVDYDDYEENDEGQIQIPSFKKWFKTFGWKQFWFEDNIDQGEYIFVKPLKVNEGLQDILKPKSKEEVAAALKHQEINKTLLDSIRVKSLDGVMYALENGADRVTSSSYYGKTMKESLGEFLIKYRDEILSKNISQKVSDNLLKRASQLGFTGLMKFALDNGADINFQDGFLSTPLYYAAKHQELEAVKILVEKGADIEIPNKDGVTPLLASLTPANNDGSANSKPIDDRVFWYLIESGADFTKQSNIGSSIINLAVGKGKLTSEIFDKIQITPRENELVSIVRGGSLKNLKDIVEKGILDVNKPIKGDHPYIKQDKEKHTPLEQLMFDNTTNISKAKYLIKNGAKITKYFLKNLKDWILEANSASYRMDKTAEWIKFLEENNIKGPTIKRDSRGRAYISESMGEVLKPKSQKQIMEDLSQKMYLDLLENKALSFFEPLFAEGPHQIFPAWQSIDFTFDEYNRVFGPGLYLMSIKIKDEGTNPLQNIFKLKQTPNPKLQMTQQQINNLLFKQRNGGVLIYDVHPSELETAIKELIAQVMTGKFGNGFHIKYFYPVNESHGIFKPKKVEDVIESLVNNILRDYGDHTMHFHKDEYWRDPPVKLSHHSGDGFMNQLFKRYGNVSGIYVHIEDNDPTESKGDNLNLLRKYLHNLNVRYTPIGHNTIIIRDDDQERRIITKLCREVYNKVLPSIMVRKFGRPINIR